MLAGAEEACWAHNPKVVGSKPTRATLLHLSPPARAKKTVFSRDSRHRHGNILVILPHLVYGGLAQLVERPLRMR